MLRFLKLLSLGCLSLICASVFAAPAIVDITTSTSAATTIPAALGSYATGNLLVVSVAQKQGTVLPAMTLPSGWTSVFTNNAVDGGGFQVVHNVYLKESDGGEGSTLNITSSDGGSTVVQVLEISDHNGLNVSATNFTEGQFTTTPSVGAVTTDENGELVLIFLSNSSVADPFEPTVPTSTTLGSHLNNSTQIAMSSAYFEQVSAGSTGTKQWANGDASVSNVVMFAISPAAGGGGATIPIISNNRRRR